MISAELPVHYRNHNVNTGVPINEGPDAYVLELVARTVGSKGELSADRYMQHGLYKQLSNLPASPDNWQTGLNMVLDALAIERIV